MASEAPPGPAIWDPLKSLPLPGLSFPLCKVSGLASEAPSSRPSDGEGASSAQASVSLSDPKASLWPDVPDVAARRALGASLASDTYCWSDLWQVPEASEELGLRPLPHAEIGGSEILPLKTAFQLSASWGEI